MVNLSKSTLVWLALSAGTILVACNAVLGITEATVDPTFGSGGGSSSASTGGPSTPCTAYCQTINHNCKDDNQEYNTEQVCESMCASFDPGAPGDTANDSLACRAYHANLAATDPVTHCRQAGPLGVGTCNSDPCRPFCLLAYNLCAPVGLFPFPAGSTDGGVKDCRTECANFAYITESDAGAYVGDLAFLNKDNLNCRLYHLESAYDTSTPGAITTHCPHSATDSATCN
jgi:hypothetical protein